MTLDGLVDTRSAASLLGVSARRVHQLAEAGEIDRPARGLYDLLSIERHLLERRGSSERPWSSRTAWAAIALLSGSTPRPALLDERSVYRLEAALRTITAAELVGKTRRRATVHRYRGHTTAARSMRTDVIVREWAMAGLADPTSDDVDGYVASAVLTSIVDRYALVAAPSGNVTLRATDIDLTIVRALARGSDVLIALDAAGTIDTRVRTAGEAVLTRALESFGERRDRER